MKEPRIKLLLTVLFIALAALAWLGSIDDVGREYTDKGFKRALVTFAVARSLNGVISVAQGTEVAIEPAGIGINFTPGQILDPINDLVERFSWIMLASSTSLGLQKMLLSIFSSSSVTYLILFTLFMALVATWYHGKQSAWFRPVAYKAALLMVVIRFCIPFVAVASEGMFHFFLEDQYTASTQHIEQTTGDIARINERAEGDTAVKEDESLLEKAQRMVNSATSRMDIKTHIKHYQEAAADASEHAINLIVIFTLQTIILPLLMLWILLQGLKRVMRLRLFG